MKKLLLLVLLLTQTIVSNSQSVITTWKNQIIQDVKGNLIVKSTNYETIEMTVYNNTLIVKDQANSVYRIISDEPVTKNEKEGVYKFYNAKDEEFRDCSIVIMKPYNSSLNDPFVAVMYPMYWYIYYIKTSN
jgi:hypothetical protein